MRFKATMLTAALATALGLIPVAARVARADVTAPLPISSFGQIVADTAHGHLYITQASGDTIAVTDLFGAPVRTITGESGVDALALSPDGKTLYAALGTADAVSAISTTTLAETARYSLGSGNSPASLAVQDGKVWVSYETAGNQGAIGEIDPAAATPFTPAALAGTWLAAPALAADPSGGGIVVARDGQHAEASYDVSTDPVTTLVAPGSSPPCQTDGGLAVLPGGASVIMPCTSDVYRTSDLSAITSPYPGGILPVFAVAPSGLVATGGAAVNSSTGESQLRLLIYPAAGGAAQAAATLPNTAGALSFAGMSWAANGSGVFTVIRNRSDLVSQPDTFTLREFFPAGAPTILAFWGPNRNAAPSTRPAGRAFSLTGTLKAASGPVAQGTVIGITRTCPGTSARKLTAKTGKGGAFSATDTLNATVTCTYTASFGGTPALAPARARVTVTGVKTRPALTVRTSAGTVNYESRVKVTVRLAATDGNRKVALYAARPGSAKRLLWRGAVHGARGVTVRSPALTRNTRFVAAFAGDAGDYPVTTGQWVRVRVRVLDAIAGYYKTWRGSPPIRFYHRDGKVRLAAKVIPGEPGQCFKMRVQVSAGGGWKANTLSRCGHLSRASLGRGYLTVRHATLWRRYRVRIDYIPGKNDRDSAGHGPWLYFIVTK